MSDSPAPLAPPAPPCSDDEFRRLLEGMLERGYRLAYRMTRDGQEAEDIVQESALRAFRARHQFTSGSSFPAWFYRIVLNTTYTLAKRRHPVASMDALADAHELYLYRHCLDAGLVRGEDDPLGGTVSRMSGEEVADALHALPEEFRTVCTLYFLDDLSYQEIAETLGVPVGTVRSRLHRGRRMLQKSLWSLATDLGIVNPATAGGTP